MEVERARFALLDTLHTRGAGSLPADRDALAGMESWVARLAGPYEGDLVAEEMRGPGAAHAVLAQPMVYVHAPLLSFVPPGSIADAATISFKDALLACLVEPPAPRTERSMLVRVRDAYRGGAEVEQLTPQVRLLEEAEAGLPFLARAWEARVEDASDSSELRDLARALRKAPVEHAVQAARAALLVVAMDEPSTGTEPTELDGERPHDVRIGWVGLAPSTVGTSTVGASTFASKLLLRVRRHVDPAWISSSRRAEYAAGLDGCALALDLVADLEARR